MSTVWRFPVLTAVAVALTATPAAAQTAGTIATVDTVIQSQFVGQHIQNTDPALARELTDDYRRIQALSEEIQRLERDLPPRGNAFHEAAVQIVRDKRNELARLEKERRKKGEKYLGVANQTIRLYGDWAIQRQEEAQAAAVAHMVANRSSWLSRRQTGPVLHVWVDRQGAMKVAGGPPSPTDVGSAANIVIQPGPAPVHPSGDAPRLPACPGGGVPLLGFCPPPPEQGRRR
jgi:hypothetical protein